MILFFPAVYLVSIMAVGGLTLLFAVLILHIYHHDNSKPVPDWLTSCMLGRKKVEHLHGEKQNGSMSNGGSMSDIGPLRHNISIHDEEVDVNSLIAMKNMAESEKLQLVLLHGILGESRLKRRLMMENNRESNTHGEWQELARKLDKLLFYIFFCITSIINITVLILLSRS